MISDRQESRTTIQLRDVFGAADISILLHERRRAISTAKVQICFIHVRRTARTMCILDQFGTVGVRRAAFHVVLSRWTKRAMGTAGMERGPGCSTVCLGV